MPSSAQEADAVAMQSATVMSMSGLWSAEGLGSRGAPGGLLTPKAAALFAGVSALAAMMFVACRVAAGHRHRRAIAADDSQLMATDDEVLA